MSRLLNTSYTIILLWMMHTTFLVQPLPLKLTSKLLSRQARGLFKKLTDTLPKYTPRYQEAFAGSVCPNVGSIKPEFVGKVAQKGKGIIDKMPQNMINIPAGEKVINAAKDMGFRSTASYA